MVDEFPKKGREKMMMRLGVIICMALFIGGNSSAAYGMCLLPDVTKGFEQAKAVFIGEVDAIIPPRTTRTDAPFFDRAHVIQFNIERSWKGLPFGYLKVWALQGDETFVLIRFKKGERYLVYADPILSAEASADELKVDGCNRTALLPRDAKQSNVAVSFKFDRDNGTKDLRVLDSLLLMPTTKRLNL